MDKKLVILVGLPGSGKSTKAKELAGTEGIILSTDEFFMKDGEYQFDFTKCSDAQFSDFS